MFINKKLFKCVLKGTSESIVFNTDISENNNGYSSRYQKYTQPLTKVSLQFNNLNETGTPGNPMANIREAFYVAKGQLHGFRVQSLLDDYNKLFITPTATGNYTQKITKTYNFGNYTYERTNILPNVDDDVLSLTDSLGRVLILGVDYNLDNLSGVLTIYNSTIQTYTLKHSFDIPMRFNQDELTFTGDTNTPYNGVIQSCQVELIEIRDINSYNYQWNT